MKGARSSDPAPLHLVRSLLLTYWQSIGIGPIPSPPGPVALTDTLTVRSASDNTCHTKRAVRPESNCPRSAGVRSMSKLPPEMLMAPGRMPVIVAPDSLWTNSVTCCRSGLPAGPPLLITLHPAVTPPSSKEAPGFGGSGVRVGRSVLVGLPVGCSLTIGVRVARSVLVGFDVACSLTIGVRVARSVLVGLPVGCSLMIGVRVGRSVLVGLPVGCSLMIGVRVGRSVLVGLPVVCSLMIGVRVARSVLVGLPVLCSLMIGVRVARSVLVGLPVGCSLMIGVRVARSVLVGLAVLCSLMIGVRVARSVLVGLAVLC